jgi:hypothetical protein
LEFSEFAKGIVGYITHETQSLDAVLGGKKKGMLSLAFLSPLALVAKLELSTK